jgi:uncharacterized protein (TIGR03435 family)
MRTFACAIALCLCLSAQTPLAFDAASVKPAPPDRGSVMYYRTPPGGRVSVSNATLKLLIQNVYRVRDFQVSGGPPWIATKGWDIEATPGSNAPPAITPEQRDEMFKTMLVDRFRLVLHRETKELPVYDLVVAKGGSKLRPSGDEPGFGMTNTGSITFKKTTVPTFANVLSGVLGRKVIDKTGLEGNFDVDLHWTPDDHADAQPDDGGPSIFTAIQEQLGLRLQSSKGPVEVLVIDRAEQPSDN